MKTFHVDNSEIKEQVGRLETIHRSALPVAIRGTLNDAVYDVKTRTMPKSAEVFKKRQSNFFKANSKFEKATGFNVNTMKATVGFYENKLVHQGTNYAVKDLEEQEEGGSIEHKAFIAMKPARQGNKMVRPNARLSAIKDKQFIKTSRVGKSRTGGTISIKSKKQQYIRAAIYAVQKYGRNAFVLGGRNGNGSRTLSHINNVNITKASYTFGGGGKTQRVSKLSIERTPLYNVKKGRAVSVNPTHFMKRASMETGLKLNSFFIAQAEKQFAKLK